MSAMTVWMKRLCENLRTLRDAEPKGPAKLVLHDAEETIRDLCAIVDRADPTGEHKREYYLAKTRTS